MSLLLVAFALSGCAQSPAPAAESPDASPQWLNLPSVEYVGANLPLPTSEAQARVPEGYTPNPYRGLEGVSIERLMALRHDEAVVDGKAVAARATVLHGFPVTPPDAVEGIDSHFFLLDVATDAPEVAGLFTAWAGRAFEAGDATVATSTTGPARSAEARFGSSTLTLAAAAPPQSREGFPARMHVVGDDGAIRAIDFLVGPFVSNDGAAHVRVGANAPRSGTGAYAAGDAYDWTFVPVASPRAPIAKFP